MVKLCRALVLVSVSFVLAPLWVACSSTSEESTEGSSDVTEEPSVQREAAYMLQQPVEMTIEVSSSSIKETGALHPDFTCEGADFSPHIKWESVPEATKSVAVVIQDLDADEGLFAHWVLWDKFAS